MRGSALLALTACATMLAPAGIADDGDFTEDFRLEDCAFSDRGRNPYFSIEPGDQLVFEGDEDGEKLLLQITVLRDRQMIRFDAGDGEPVSVRTRVVEEREWVDGELVEVSRNFFARCTATGDIVYFGEDVDNYEDGEVANHDGSWRAGTDGAVPGVIMPGTFLLGSRYFQEQAPGIALDRAEHVEMGLEVEVPAGTFEDCVEVEETSALEPGAESTKVYCPGIGMVQDDEALLVRYGRQPPSAGRRIK